MTASGSVSEEEVSRALRAVFSRVEAIRDVLPGLADPVQLTALARDDAATGPYKGSHAAGRSVIAAVEHLDALRVLIMDARVLHPSAPFTLVRAALETASAAVWLLGPDEHKERVVRALRHAAQDARDGSRIAQEVGAPEPRPLDVRLGEMQQFASAVGHTGTLRSPSSTECVTDAEAETSSVYPVLAMWQLCSGFAHGRTWATVSWLDREEFASGVPGDVKLRVTSSLDKVLMVALTAAEVVDRALELYSIRNTSPFRR